MANTKVVEIGEFRLTRSRREFFDTGCKHLHTTIDSEGDVVTCDDCKQQLSAVWVLRSLCDSYVKAQERLAALQSSVREVAAKQVGMKAAQQVEKAWRSRSMVPTCPHCHEAIFPEDGFGGSATNREIAVRRRKCAAAAGDPTRATP